MRSILRSTFIKSKNVSETSQISVVREEIICDTAAELPEVVQEDRELYHGSIGYVINEDALYILNGEGEWTKEGE